MLFVPYQHFALCSLASCNVSNQDPGYLSAGTLVHLSVIFYFIEGRFAEHTFLFCRNKLLHTNAFTHSHVSRAVQGVKRLAQGHVSGSNERGANVAVSLLCSDSSCQFRECFTLAKYRPSLPQHASLSQTAVTLPAGSQ